MVEIPTKIHNLQHIPTKIYLTANLFFVAPLPKPRFTVSQKEPCGSERGAGVRVWRTLRRAERLNDGAHLWLGVWLGGLGGLFFCVFLFGGAGGERGLGGGGWFGGGTRRLFKHCGHG